MEFRGFIIKNHISSNIAHHLECIVLASSHNLNEYIIDYRLAEIPNIARILHVIDILLFDEIRGALPGSSTPSKVALRRFQLLPMHQLLKPFLVLYFSRVLNLLLMIMHSKQ